MTFPYPQELPPRSPRRSKTRGVIGGGQQCREQADTDTVMLGNCVTRRFGPPTHMSEFPRPLILERPRGTSYHQLYEGDRKWLLKANLGLQEAQKRRLLVQERRREAEEEQRWRAGPKPPRCLPNGDILGRKGETHLCLYPGQWQALDRYDEGLRRLVPLCDPVEFEVYDARALALDDDNSPGYISVTLLSKVHPVDRYAIIDPLDTGMQFRVVSFTHDEDYELPDEIEPGQPLTEAQQQLLKGMFQIKYQIGMDNKYERCLKVVWEVIPGVEHRHGYTLQATLHNAWFEYEDAHLDAWSRLPNLDSLHWGTTQ